MVRRRSTTRFGSIRHYCRVFERRSRCWSQGRDHFDEQMLWREDNDLWSRHSTDAAKLDVVERRFVVWSNYCHRERNDYWARRERGREQRWPELNGEASTRSSLGEGISPRSPDRCSQPPESTTSIEEENKCWRQTVYTDRRHSEYRNWNGRARWSWHRR